MTEISLIVTLNKQFNSKFYKINPLLHVQEVRERKRETDDNRTFSKKHFASLEVMERVIVDRRIFNRMVYQ